MLKIKQPLHTKNIVIFLFSEIINQQKQCYFIQEYCHTDLATKINKREGNMLEIQAQRLLFYLINGLSEYHEQKICHRALSPEKIHFLGNIPKIGGFQENIEYQNETSKFNKYVPNSYSSPQIIFEQPYTYKCDIWSLGTIYFQMICGVLPGSGQDDLSRCTYIQQHKLKFPYNTWITKESRDFLEHVLKIEEKDRFSYEEHPIYTQFLDSPDLLNFDQPKCDVLKLNEEALINMDKLHRFMKSIGNANVESIMNQYLIDDQLEIKQFHRLCLEAQVDEHIITALFNYIDINKDGSISKQEFEFRVLYTSYDQSYINNFKLQNIKGQKAVQNLQNMVVRQNIDVLKLFQKYNVNSDSKISKDELKALIMKIDDSLTEQEIEYTFCIFDANQTGEITIDEFIKTILPDSIHLQCFKKIEQAKGMKFTQFGVRILREIKQIFEIYNVDPEEIWMKINSENSNYLGKQNFIDFLQLFNKKANLYELDGIFEIFADENGKIPIQDFIEFFS